MKKKATTFLLLCSVFLMAKVVSGQDVAYTQFYANPLYLNPALAGSKLCPRLTLNYRNHFPALNKGYVSYSASYDQHFDNLSGGIGILVNADNFRSGVMTDYSANVMYSFKFRVFRNLTVNTALQTGYVQHNLNWNKLVFEDQIVPGTYEIIPTSEPIPEHTMRGNIDYATGLLIGYRESMYIGAALHHITEPDMAFYSGNLNRLDMKITIHAGAYINLVDKFWRGEPEDPAIAPNIVYMQQGAFRQLNAGTYLNLYPLSTGIWIRHTVDAINTLDALMVLIGIQQPRFKVGYSFDFPLNRVNISSGGAHELSFAWQFDCPKKEMKYRAIKCPEF